MTRLRYETSSLLMVLAVPAAIALAFPYDALRFVPAPESRRAPSAAFVTLTPAQEQAALKAAKTAWQGNAEGVRRMRIDMTLGDLPADDRREAIAVSVEPTLAIPPPIAYGLPPDPRTQAAPAPREIGAAAPDARPPAFSKEDLLKLQ